MEATKGRKKIVEWVEMKEMTKADEKVKRKINQSFLCHSNMQKKAVYSATN